MKKVFFCFLFLCFFPYVSFVRFPLARHERLLSLVKIVQRQIPLVGKIKPRYSKEVLSMNTGSLKSIDVKIHTLIFSGFPTFINIYNI